MRIWLSYKCLRVLYASGFEAPETLVADGLPLALVFHHDDPVDVAPMKRSLC